MNLLINNPGIIENKLFSQNNLEVVEQTCIIHISLTDLKNYEWCTCAAIGSICDPRKP